MSCFPCVLTTMDVRLHIFYISITDNDITLHCTSHRVWAQSEATTVLGLVFFLLQSFLVQPNHVSHWLGKKRNPLQHACQYRRSSTLNRRDWTRSRWVEIHAPQTREHYT